MCDSEQLPAVMHTATYVTSNSPSPMPSQQIHAHVATAVVSPSSCSEQVNTTMSDSDAAETNAHYKTRAQRARSSARSDTVSTAANAAPPATAATAVAAPPSTAAAAAADDVLKHTGYSDDAPQAESLPTAVATMQSPLESTAPSIMPSLPAAAVSRNNPTNPVVQNPPQAAKEIWLGFVRRAYRKFGKEMLSDMDLRWKTRGALALAAAWRRTDVARYTASSQRISAHASDAVDTAASEEDVIMELALTSHANAVSSQLTASTSSSSSANEQQVCSSLKAKAQLQQALTNMLRAGGEGTSACNWLLTWPSDMMELNVDQLVLLPRNAALHRSRNRHARRSTRVVSVTSGSTAE
jgi:hypothetical protein